MVFLPEIPPRPDIFDIPVGAGYVDAMNRFYAQEATLSRWILLKMNLPPEADYEIFEQVGTLAKAYKAAIDEGTLTLDKVATLSKGEDLVKVVQKYSSPPDDYFDMLSGGLRVLAECALELAVLTHQYEEYIRIK